MTDKQLDIFNRTTEIRTKIEESYNPAIFVLNAQVRKLQEELFALQDECDHEYEDGTCKYCGKKEVQ